MDLIFLLYVSLLLIALFSVFKFNKKIERLLLFLFMTVLVFLSGFRSQTIGYDTVGHLNYFISSSISIQAAFDFKEPGYGLLSLIVSNFGGFQLFLVIISILSITLLYKSTSYFALYPLISLYVFVMSYFTENNLAKIRQSTAVLILLFSLKYLYKKRLIPFIIIVILGASFHTSALVFLVVPFLLKIQLNQKRTIIIFLIALLLYFSRVPIIFYREWIPMIFANINLDFLNISSFVNYADRDSTLREAGGFIGYLYHVGLIIPVVLFYNKIKSFVNEKTMFLINIYFWGSIVFMVLFDLSLINSRFSMFFLMAGIFALPNLIMSIKKPYDKLILIIFFIIVVFVRSILNYINLRELYYPFEFFWGS